MSEVRKVGERGVTYSMVDRDCIARTCFAPGRYQHRGATMSGSRNTGAFSHTCMTRAYRGCPYGEGGEKLPADPVLRKQRTAEGWRNA